jgi:hypothetical protein
MDKYDELMKKVERELSGYKVFQNSSYITQFLRAPGSDGLHSVLNFLEGKLNQIGLDKVHKIEYPSEKYGTETLRFVGWDVKDAKLEVIEPVYKNIISYDEAPTCVQWWSSGTPDEGVIADLIDVGSGVEESCYSGKNVSGKIVLVSGNNQAEGNTRAFQLAVEKYGAIGLVTDNLPYAQPPFRTRENHPEAVSFLRIRTKSNKGWAFVISSIMGNYLRNLLQQGPVKIRAFVDAEYTDKKDWELVGEIKGRDLQDEEVWFVLHCSGPKPGANCASGAALGVEIARTIMELINNGEIQRPRRTIKFFIGVEGDGLNSYLHIKNNHTLDVKAAFVFCSVGDDQEKNNSSLLIYRSPDSIPTYVNDVCEDAIQKASIDALTPYSALKPDIPLIRFYSRPFTPMSDNSRLMTMKIPCPTFWSWPSRNFHTQFYTVDKLDPKVIKRCGLVATYSALKIANTDELESIKIAHIMRTRTISRLQQASSDAIYQLGKIKTDEIKEDHASNIIQYFIEKIEYIYEKDMLSLDTIKTLTNKSEKLEQTINEIKDEIKTVTKNEINKINDYKIILEG